MLARDLPRSPITVDPDLIGPVARHLVATGKTFKALVQDELTALCDDDVPLPATVAGPDPAGRLRRDGTVSSRIGRPLISGDPVATKTSKPQPKSAKKPAPKKPVREPVVEHKRRRQATKPAE